MSKPMHSSPLHSESHFTTKKCQSACDTSPLDTFPLYTFIPLLRHSLTGLGTLRSLLSSLVQARGRWPSVHTGIC